MHPVKEFDSLPDDAVVPRRVTAAVLHMSERTVRRSVRTVNLSARRRGNRVGDIRAIVRGDTCRGRKARQRAPTRPGQEELIRTWEMASYAEHRPLSNPSCTDGARLRRKGDRVERKIVRRHIAPGIRSERYLLSGASGFRGSGHGCHPLGLMSSRLSAPACCSCHRW
jgi:hypothetical protein